MFLNKELQLTRNLKKLENQSNLQCYCGMSKRGAEDLLTSPGTGDSLAKKMDTKSSPTKDIDGETDQKDAIVTRIKETAPEWFSEAFTFIIRTIKEESFAAKTAQGQLECKIEVLESQISNLELKREEQDTVIAKLKDEINNLESYSRRDNLVLEGIQESPNENLRDKVVDFFKKKLKQQDASNIQLSRLHRLGRPLYHSNYAPVRPRPVIVRFQNFDERERVWKASWSLHEKNLFVREDFTEVTRKRRNHLLPVLKAAKRDPNIQKCSLRGDKLVLDGRTYRVEDFEKIPENLKWSTKGERYFQKCDSTFFFGSQCYLSNHHPSPIEEQGTTYTCVEQLYLRKKALFFDDVDTARKIMKESNPGVIKRLSHSIKGLDEKQWKPQARTVMEKACYLKFSQNKTLREKLIASQGLLVESNKRDKFFSCGLSLADPNILDQNKWEGGNILGDILTTLRETLKK